jgi:hypothetical protein
VPVIFEANGCALANLLESIDSRIIRKELNRNFGGDVWLDNFITIGLSITAMV